jgi:hypothetical protein
MINLPLCICSCRWQVWSQFPDTEYSFWLCVTLVYFCCRCYEWRATRSVPVGNLRELGDGVWLINVWFSILLFFPPCFSSVGHSLPVKAVWTSHFQVTECGVMGPSDRAIKIFEKELWRISLILKKDIYMLADIVVIWGRGC